MKNSLYVLFRTSIAIAISFALISCTSFAQKDKTPSIIKTFTMSGSGNLDATTSGGGITVEGHDGNQVEVNVFVWHENKLLAPGDPFLSTLEQGYEMKIEKSGNTVTAFAKRKDQGKKWHRTSIAYRILVPHNMSCNLHTSGGGLTLTEVSGKQELHTSGGGITMKDINGETSAHTSGGGITVERADGNMELHTSGGGITVKDANGNINAQTSGGGIHLDDIHGEIEARTSGGGIHVSGKAGYVKASTSGGNIHVDISDLSKGLHLETSGGGIHANIPGSKGMDLDLKAQKVNIALQNFSGKAEKNSVEGTMHGGGIPVHMHASGGHITVEF